MDGKGTILVVDDDLGSLRMLVQVLSAADFRVRPASSGALALTAIGLSPPDLVLLDIRMPGMDGFEVCRRIKDDARSRHLPVIFLSAEADRQERVEGFRLGAVDFVSKPFQREELLARVDTHLTLSRLRQHLEATVALRTQELSTANRELQQEVLEHRRTEEALQAERQNLHELIEFSPVGMLVLDPEQVIVRVNGLAAALLRRTPAELLGRRPSDVLGCHDAASPLARPHPPDCPFCSPDRGLAAVLAGTATLRGAECPLLLHRDDGHDPAWLSVGAEAIRMEGSRRLVVALDDITRRKRVEQEKQDLQAQLAQAQKMESIGRLAGGVAHDFNNMLGVILGNTEAALEQVDPQGALHEVLLETQEAALRSSELTRQLLAFARKQPVSPRQLVLNDAIEGLLAMLRRLLGENISLAWQPQAELWPIRMDPSQIDNILTNLCVNSRDAITDIGTIVIATANITITPETCAAHPGSAPGEYVQLTVRDSGSGMSKETLAHLFEPFFTTKSLGKGTGLGLAMVYGAVRQNNGFVEVASEPGHGSTFSIYLPRYHGEGEAALAPQRGPARQGRQRGHPAGGGRGAAAPVDAAPAGAAGLRGAGRAVSAGSPAPGPGARRGDWPADDRRHHAGDERPRPGPAAAAGLPPAAAPVHVGLHRRHHRPPRGAGGRHPLPAEAVQS